MEYVIIVKLFSAIKRNIQVIEAIKGSYTNKNKSYANFEMSVSVFGTETGAENFKAELSVI